MGTQASAGVIFSGTIYFHAPNVKVTCNALGFNYKSRQPILEQHVSFISDQQLLATAGCMRRSTQQSNGCFSSFEECSFNFRKNVHSCWSHSNSATTQSNVFYISIVNEIELSASLTSKTTLPFKRIRTNLYKRNHILKMASLLHHMLCHDHFVHTDGSKRYFRRWSMFSSICLV